MNKLINRISPETSENRILHAGFSIILMSEEITQTLSGLSSDMIIFILSGSITIYSTKEEKKTIGEQYMIFLRSFENYTYDITLGSKIIIFFFIIRTPSLPDNSGSGLQRAWHTPRPSPAADRGCLPR